MSSRGTMGCSASASAFLPTRSRSGGATCNTCVGIDHRGGYERPVECRVPDAPQEYDSARALTEALSAGANVISEAVYAELAAHPTALEGLDWFLRDTGIRPQPSSSETLYLAGKTWREYLRRRPEPLGLPVMWDSPRHAVCAMRNKPTSALARYRGFPHWRPCYGPRQPRADERPRVLPTLLSRTQAGVGADRRSTPTLERVSYETPRAPSHQSEPRCSRARKPVPQPMRTIRGIATG